MISTKGMTVATLVAIAAAALSTALPAAARGPGPDRMGAGPMQMLDFDTLDTDKDGKITKAELAAGRAAAVAGTDANKDGKLSADELAAQDVKMMTERAKTRAARMIEGFDTDGDGLLSAAELAARPMPGKLFERLDTDGDGAVSQAEADAAREKMADRMGDRPDGGRRRHQPVESDTEQN